MWDVVRGGGWGAVGQGIAGKSLYRRPNLAVNLKPLGKESKKTRREGGWERRDSASDSWWWKGRAASGWWTRSTTRSPRAVAVPPGPPAAHSAPLTGRRLGSSQGPGTWHKLPSNGVAPGGSRWLQALPLQERQSQRARGFPGRSLVPRGRRGSFWAEKPRLDCGLPGDRVSVVWMEPSPPPQGTSWLLPGRCEWSRHKPPCAGRACT